MAWQFTSSQPIYTQIVDTLEIMIFGGQYAMGERLPSVRELAETAAVNPNTMQRALAELEARGLAQTQRNSGRTVTTDETVIMRAKRERAERLTAEYLERMRMLGMTREAIIALLEQGEEEEDNERDT